MRQKLFLIFMLVLFAQTAFPWGHLGHQTIVKVAEKHLTPQAQEIIQNLLHHDLSDDCSWMDSHRTGEWAFTNHWHTLYFDKNLNYDPNPTLTINKKTGVTENRGDALSSANRAVYTLSNYKSLDDSTFMFNLRCLIHMIGDMHCPTHSLIPGRTKLHPNVHDGHEYYPVLGGSGKVKYRGKEFKSFHSVYDGMPNVLWPGKTADQVVEIIDTKNKKEIKKIIGQKNMPQYNGCYDCTIPFYSWAHQCAETSMKIWDINPEIYPDLNPATADLSRPIVEQQLRNAGYRLAWILNTILK